MLTYSKYRANKAGKNRGYSIAELPAGMIFLFIGIFMPMIVLSSMTYRAMLLYFAARDSCVRAAKAPTFTEAQSRATLYFNRAVAGFSEISGTQNIVIMIKPIPTGTATFRSTPLAAGTVNTTNNLYLIRETIVGRVSPLIGMRGGFFGLNIPGLTTDFPLNMRYDALVENPNGLTE